MNKIDSYIQKQPSPQKEICQSLRKIIFSTFPDISEEMQWGVPSYDHGKYYFVALKNHVNLGFSLSGIDPKDYHLFDGGGKTMKHLKIDSLEHLDESKIIFLLKLVKNRS